MIRPPLPHPAVPPLTVLIADLDPGVRAAGSSLVGLGHRLMTGCAGEEILAAAKAHRPDVVLIGPGITQMSGHALCRAIKDHLREDVAILMMVDATAAHRETEAQAQACGVDGWLTKPFNNADLQRAVEQAWRIRQNTVRAALEAMIDRTMGPGAPGLAPRSRL